MAQPRRRVVFEQLTKNRPAREPALGPAAIAADNAGWGPMPPTAGKPSHTRPAQVSEGVGLRNEASRILIEAGLPPADRRVRFIDFRDGELAAGSTTWAEAFDGAPRRFLSAPDFTPDLLLGASTWDFLIVLRAD